MSDRIRLSKNFYLDEFTASETARRLGIDMSLDNESLVLSRLTYLAENVLHPLRAALGPVLITCGYRPLALNKKIGGAENSAHLFGSAADIRVPGKTTLEVAEWIAENISNFDQVINEHDSWVHVGVTFNQQPREQSLTAISIAGVYRSKTVYIPGLFDVFSARLEYLKGL